MTGSQRFGMPKTADYWPLIFKISSLNLLYKCIKKTSLEFFYWKSSEVRSGRFAGACSSINFQYIHGHAQLLFTDWACIFNNTKIIKSELNGNTSCNPFRIKVNIYGHKLSFGKQMAMTMMACEGENIFRNIKKSK